MAKRGRNDRYLFLLGLCLAVLAGMVLLLAADMPGTKNEKTAAPIAARPWAATLPPTPAPTVQPTFTAAPEATAEPTPEPTPTPMLEASCTQQSDPGRATLGYSYQVQAREQMVSDYLRAAPIAMGLPEQYTQIAGVLTFRGNHFRDAPAYGTAQIASETLKKGWSLGIGGIDKWTGVGWNGQPAIVKWPRETIQVMNIYEEKKQKDDLVEVIYAAMDGKIYFLDLQDGSFTRDPIDIGFPIKGSVCVDPRGYPLLYCGQGIGENGGVTGDMGYRVFSLIDSSVLLFINGADSFNLRYWRAFDSVPLVDGASDTLILCGENGILYTVVLNSVFDPQAGTVSIDPEIVRYRYQANHTVQLGIENSPAVYHHYVYFADNSGTVQCVDLNTMSPVWVDVNQDDSDASVVLDVMPDGSVSLYTGCEVDKQGNLGQSVLRRYDAMNGTVLWEHRYACYFNEDVNGGLLATPVSGKNELEQMVFFWIARTQVSGGAGTLLAVDKQSGAIVWEKQMRTFGWSSPVPLYTPEGKGYLIVCDAAGRVYLIRGMDGEILDQISLGANIEGSPAAFGNTLVVGTRGQQIWSFTVQ